MNEIRYGTIIFGDRSIVEGSCCTQHSMNGETLAIDTLKFTVYSGTEPTSFLTSDNEVFIDFVGDVFYCLLQEYFEMSSFVLSEPLYYYCDGKFVGKFYVEEIKKVGTGLYEFSCNSPIGILANSMHYGGMYSGTALSTILEEMLAGIPYTIDQSVQDFKIYGWLPYDAKRNNLQQLTIATGLAVKTLSNGNVHITALTSNVMGTFGTNRVCLNGSISESTPYSAVVVTEHTYSEITDEIKLYDDTFFGEETIIFSEPAHDLTITGGTIVESGANYAIVNGSGSVVLTGQKYLHTTKEVSEGNGASTAENIITISNVTVITLLNSIDVAERMYNLYSATKTVEQDVLYGTERPGDIVSVINPLTIEAESACVKKFDITLGSMAVAKGSFLMDYIPMNPSSGYENRAFITSSGTFTVPDGVTRMRVILIGGGQGGQGGSDGEDGSAASFVWDDNYTVYDGGAGGTGGSGGTAGSAAKILNTTIEVTSGQVITVTIGTGGAGGADGADGANGTPTIFGTFSTANGAVPDRGYVDIYTGNIYALTGDDGVDGAAGGNGSQTSTGADGSNTETGEGGSGGSFLSSSYDKAGGGGGGGAAHESDGENGTSATLVPYDGKYDYRQISGDGGNGASPEAPDSVSYGYGGNGGHGGGGAGGAGGYKSKDNYQQYSHQVGVPGIGGQGSSGGPGGSGCAIIYY